MEHLESIQVLHLFHICHATTFQNRLNYVFLPQNSTHYADNNQSEKALIEIIAKGT